MDGFRHGNFKQKIFDELDVFKHVTFPEIPHFYRVLANGRDIEVPHNISKAKALLIHEFPHEHAGVTVFYNRMENFRKYRPENESETFESVGTYLDRIISDDTLKLVLLGNMMAFGDDPYLLSMNYYAQAQGAYYQSGSVFIQGGSQALSDYLANYIRSNGGTILLRNMADEILSNQDRCTGVIFRSLNDGKMHTARSRQVIVNAALPQLAARLLPKAHGEKVSVSISNRSIGASLYTLYLCFEKPLREMMNPSYCTCVYGPAVKSPKDIGINNHGEFKNRTFILTDYSHIPSGLAPDGKSFAAVVAVDYQSNWDGLDRATYKKRKDEITASFLLRLEELIPGFNKHLAWHDAATSKTLERFTNNTSGAVYGFAQLPGPRSKQRVSPFENLFIASAWDKFGGGFSGAIYSGYFAAMDALRQNRLSGK